MSKLIRFFLVNLQSGEKQVEAYIDASRVVSWNRWKVPDDLTPGGAVHRSFRGKMLVTLNMEQGMTHWTDEDFDSVSARLLAARGQTAEADEHAAKFNEKSRLLV